MIVKSEYLFNKPKLNETNDFKKNTILEHDQKYGDNYCRKFEVRGNIKFFAKIKKDEKYYD